MNSSLHLIIHNIVCIISTITLFAMAFFTFLNGRHKTANVAWSLMMLAITVFTISHVIGVNIDNPAISRIVLTFNVSLFFIAAFNLHSVLAFCGLADKKKWLIYTSYAIASGAVIFFSFFPQLFLIDSVPKMYFPNYYEPGILNISRIIFLYGLVVPYCLYILYGARKTASTPIDSKRYTYLFLTMLIGYAIGFIPNFLVYDIAIDPLWGMAFSMVFATVFTYGAIRYELFDIKVIAKQAFFYSLAIVGVGGFIILLNSSQQWIRLLIPNFPGWIIALISSVLVVTIGVLAWRNLRKTDILKYEFITTVTHKFRTPLTHIKWASENLSNRNLPAEDKTQVEYIQNANSKLVELTNLLVNVSEEEKGTEDYRLKTNSISEIAETLAQSLIQESIAKHITLSKNIEPNITSVFDEHRIRFVIQTLVENAINYTASGGTVRISLKKEAGHIVCSVTDSGIGIPAEEVPLLFSKFYRGTKAKVTDTEGMGIGLFMSKEIIEHHKGKIWVESAGLGTGSTFSFSLPIITA
ncbi:MAG: ATP-binding protein [Patescibacteria group bacterium]